MGTSLGELGRRLNQARSIGGLGFATAVAAMGLFTDPVVIAIGLAVALYNRAEVYYRNRHPETPAFAVFASDAVVAGAALLVIGPIPPIIVAMFGYTLITSLFWVTRFQVVVLGLTLTTFVVASELYTGLRISLGANETLLITGTVSIFAAFTLWMADSAARTIRAGAEIERQALKKEREASAMKSRFVSMISHELRTPITSLMGFAETLEEAWGALPEAEAKEFLSIMHGEARHLQKLVEDILLIPGLEAGRLPIEFRDFSINETMDVVGKALFPEGSPWNLSVRLPGATVHADPGRTQQILRNLLRNAQKYGGTNITVGGQVINEWLRITIADDGPGIPSDQQERVFEAFEQIEQGDTRREGLGLGLAISRALARAMGGDVWYQDGQGATFVVELPLSRQIRLVA